MKYRHFKGEVYTFLHEASFTDGAQLLRVIVYSDDTDRVWVRSAQEFFGTVEYHGEIVSRFEVIRKR